MAATLQVDIVSAEEALYSGEAEMVFAPAVMGEIGILPRHTPLLTALKPGEVRIKTSEGDEQNIYISGGMLEIQPHVVTILADTAIRAQNLDEAAALEAKQAAEKLLQDKQADIDYARAEIELAQAVAQLQAIQRLKKTR